jgi:hypothetical protein
MRMSSPQEGILIPVLGENTHEQLAWRMTRSCMVTGSAKAPKLFWRRKVHTNSRVSNQIVGNGRA